MIKNPFAGKSTRTKTFAVITLVAVILLLGLNLAAFAMGVYDTVFLDLTSEGLYTVRDMMVEACHDVFYLEDGSLRDPGITITFCAEPDVLIANYVTRPIYYMAIALADIYPNLTVKTVNITYNPTAIADYKTTSLTEITASDVIISYGTRYRVASALSFWNSNDDALYSFDGEYKLASIFLSLTLINQPAAYFLTGHGEDYYDFNNPESEMSLDTSYLVDLLTERGLQVKNISLDEIYKATAEHNAAHPEDKRVPSMPEDCAIVIINNPKTDFLYDESQALKFGYVSETEILDRFLTSGRGSVMVAKDYRVTLPIFEDFLREWGMEFTNTQVKDDSQHIVDGTNSGTTLVADYNTDEASYGFSIYGEYATLESAPRTIVGDTGYIKCAFDDSPNVGEAGTLNVSRIYAPFLYSSDKAQDYAYNADADAYVDLAGERGRRALAAVCGRQKLNDFTATYEYSYLFCAASAEFFSASHLGNTSYANYDIVSALAQNIARLDTRASIELGGTSLNSYTGFGGKILLNSQMSAEEVEVNGYDETGHLNLIRVNHALTTPIIVIFTIIIALLPIAVAVVGVIVRVKRKYL